MGGVESSAIIDEADTLNSRTQANNKTQSTRTTTPVGTKCLWMIRLTFKSTYFVTDLGTASA